MNVREIAPAVLTALVVSAAGVIASSSVAVEVMSSELDHSRRLLEEQGAQIEHLKDDVDAAAVEIGRLTERLHATERRQDEHYTRLSAQLESIDTQLRRRARGD